MPFIRIVKDDHHCIMPTGKNRYKVGTIWQCPRCHQIWRLGVNHPDDEHPTWNKISQQEADEWMARP